jgi:hypothetical protein
MLDIEKYSKYLRLKKKASQKRIDRYVNDVKLLEKYLDESKEGKFLKDANTKDIEEFIEDLTLQTEIIPATCSWGLATYFEYKENFELCAKAAELLWDYDPTPLKLSRIKELKIPKIWRLEQYGINDVHKVLFRGTKPEDRERLVLITNLSEEEILKVVEIAELTRLPHLKQKRVILYYNSGFNTLDKIAESTAEEIRETISDYVEKSGFDGFPPEKKEAETDILLAQHFERRVIY